jgi:hypothetical protein
MGRNCWRASQGPLAKFYGAQFAAAINNGFLSGVLGQQLAYAVAAFKFISQRQVVPGILKHRIIGKVAI